jgi:hypothetical protein
VRRSGYRISCTRVSDWSVRMAACGDGTASCADPMPGAPRRRDYSSAPGSWSCNGKQ